MEASMGVDEVLLSVGDVAELAGVSPAAVANWRARGTKGFPHPLRDGKTGPLYRRSEIVGFLAARRSAPQGLDVPLGLENSLWNAADKLRGSIDPSQYRHLILTLLFLRRVLTEASAPDGVTIPDGMSWATTIESCSAGRLGSVLAGVIETLQACNPQLGNSLPAVFGVSSIDARRLKGLVDVVSALTHDERGLRDQMGRVYEYFLGRFAQMEGRSGGEFYTPESIVRLLAEIVNPTSGVLYDPCCGSAGMFVQSQRVKQLHRSKGKLRIYGQELNPATWRLARMNLALHDIEGDLGKGPADTFHEDLHEGLQADFVLANPPFNISDWGVELLQDDARWTFGVPPSGNANLAWIQHIWAHLSAKGRAGVVLSNGTLSSDADNERTIRAGLVRADAIDCLVALPPQLFYSTSIPVTLWFLAKNKSSGPREGKVLFVDARDLGQKVTRSHRVLSDDDVARVVRLYRAFEVGEDCHEVGFARAVPLSEIEQTGFSLVPSRYVVPDAVEDGALPLADLLVEYQSLQREVQELDRVILADIEELLRA
jgi:type I restriction enzyme M protein